MYYIIRRQEIFAEKSVVNIYPIHHSQKTVYGFMMCIQNLSSHAKNFSITVRIYFYKIYLICIGT